NKVRVRGNALEVKEERTVGGHERQTDVIRQRLDVLVLNQGGVGGDLFADETERFGFGTSLENGRLRLTFGAENFGVTFTSRLRAALFGFVLALLDDETGTLSFLSGNLRLFNRLSVLIREGNVADDEVRKRQPILRQTFTETFGGSATEVFT